MTKAVLYARFSPRPGEETCQSSVNQLSDLRRYCEAQGWEVAGEYHDDALSGSDDTRAGLWDSLAALKRGYVWVVRNMDRVARDALLSLTIEKEIEKVGAQLVVTENGGLQEEDDHGKRLMRQILAAFAEYQRKVNNARTAAKMRAHQASGRRVGGTPPYGLMIDPADETRLIDNPAEQEIVRRIRGLASVGNSLNKIAEILDDAGVPARKGQWVGKHALIKRIIERGN